MKTVTICGSMRYEEQMKTISLQLEIAHEFNVLQCVYNPDSIELSNTDRQKLARSHMKKIDLSDAIYVVDIDGYIGESVKGEIEYAKNNQKEIIYHSEFVFSIA